MSEPEKESKAAIITFIKLNSEYRTFFASLPKRDADSASFETTVWDPACNESFKRLEILFGFKGWYYKMKGQKQYRVTMFQNIDKKLDIAIADAMVHPSVVKFIRETNKE
jgi:hypothetical protein